MRKPASMRALEELGRVRLSPNFFMRDMLYSEIANFHGIPNVPDDPDLAIAAGRKFCEELLEPLHATFGSVAVRSAYRSPAVNQFGNDNDLSCATNEKNRGRHIWDQRDAGGHMGAMATVAVPWFTDRYETGTDWRALAWWIHDHLPYSSQQYYPKLAAFNLAWHEKPQRVISSYINPKGVLTSPDMDNHTGSHAEWYEGFPALAKG